MVQTLDMVEGVIRRRAEVIFVVDRSGSMKQQGKMPSANRGIRTALEAAKKVDEGNVDGEVYFRVLSFGLGAHWEDRRGTHVTEIEWNDLVAENTETCMGEAFRLLSDELTAENMGKFRCRPIIVLVSDGWPTDEWEEPLEVLLSQGWGKKAVRLAIGIGDAADENVLARFIDNPAIPVFMADNAEQLAAYLEFVTTRLIDSVTRGQSMTDGTPTGLPPLPTKEEMNVSAEQVWISEA